MKRIALGMVIVASVFFGLVRHVQAGGVLYLSGLAISGAPGYHAKAAQVNAAIHKLDAMLDIANKQVQYDTFRRKVGEAVSELDEALNVYLDTVEQADPTAEQKVQIVQSLLTLYSVVEDLDIRLAETTGDSGSSTTRGRFITIIEDLNSDV